MSETKKDKSNWKFYLGVLIFSVFLAGIASFFSSHSHQGLERAIPGFKEKSHHHAHEHNHQLNNQKNQKDHHHHHHHGHQTLVRILGTILIFVGSSGTLWLLKKFKSD